jgi:hypothetical protein
MKRYRSVIVKAVFSVVISGLAFYAGSPFSAWLGGLSLGLTVASFVSTYFAAQFQEVRDAIKQIAEGE